MRRRYANGHVNRGGAIHNEQESLTRRERERLVHRQEILDAALAVFADKGFFNATLDEIALRAEFSKGAIYLYFPSKEDILVQIVDAAMDEWDEVIRELTGERSFREELTDLLRKVARYRFERRDVFALLIEQHASGFRSCPVGNRQNMEERHNRVWSDVFIPRVQKAIEAGEIRDIAPEAVAGMVHGAIDNMAITQWYCTTIDELLEGVDMFMLILFEGISRKERQS